MKISELKNAIQVYSERTVMSFLGGERRGVRGKEGEGVKKSHKKIEKMSIQSKSHKHL